MSSLLKFLVVFLSLLLLIRLALRKIFGSAPAQRSAARPKNARTITGQTVRDPQCGMYVASSLAIPSRLDGKLYHFCSAECRDRYLEGHQAKA